MRRRTAVAVPTREEERTVFRKLLMAIPMTLAFGITSYGPMDLPTEDVTIQMNNNGPAQTGGALHIQYAANAQGLNQSHNGLIRFNLKSLPAGLTAANIQSATLTMFVEAGGSPGT